jgi:sarcosine oxidase delta subunit
MPHIRLVQCPHCMAVDAPLNMAAHLPGCRRRFQIYAEQVEELLAEMTEHGDFDE